MAESNTGTSVKSNIFLDWVQWDGLLFVKLLRLCCIIIFLCVCCPGRGLFLSGKRQMVSMDGSLLNWLAALLIPLHATPT